MTEKNTETEIAEMLEIIIQEQIDGKIIRKGNFIILKFQDGQQFEFTLKERE